MKITKRVKKVPGVVSAYWNSHLNQLTIYYDSAVPKDSIKAGVVAEVADFDINAVEKFVFISLERR